MNERQIKLIRTVCPYINPHLRPHILAFLSFMEFRLNFSAINTPLNYFFTRNEPLVTDSEQLLNQLKCSVSREEQKIIDRVMMLEQMMKFMEVMQDIQGMQGMQNMSDIQGTQDNKNGSGTQGSADINRNAQNGSEGSNLNGNVGSEGSNSNGNGGFGGINFEMLKNFLPKESAETFELVKMMMENNDAQ